MKSSIAWSDDNDPAWSRSRTSFQSVNATLRLLAGTVASAFSSGERCRVRTTYTASSATSASATSPARKMRTRPGRPTLRDYPHGGSRARRGGSRPGCDRRGSGGGAQGHGAARAPPQVRRLVVPQGQAGPRRGRRRDRGARGRRGDRRRDPAGDAAAVHGVRPAGRAQQAGPLLARAGGRRPRRVDVRAQRRDRRRRLGAGRGGTRAVDLPPRPGAARRARRLAPDDAARGAAARQGAGAQEVGRRRPRAAADGRGAGAGQGDSPPCWRRTA